MAKASQLEARTVVRLHRNGGRQLRASSDRSCVTSEAPVQYRARSAWRCSW